MASGAAAGAGLSTSAESLFLPGLVLCSPVSRVWVLLLEYRELDSLGDALGCNAWLDCGDMLCLSVA